MPNIVYDSLVLSIWAYPPSVVLTKAWEANRHGVWHDLVIIVIVVQVFVHALRVHCIGMLRPGL